MRRAAKKDANHDIVCEALEASGWTVIPTFRVGDGFPDAVIARRGVVIFCEIKDGSKVPSAQKLTPDEVRFRELVEGAGLPYRIVRSVDEALSL